MPTTDRPGDHKQSLGYAALIGVGVMAGVDEIIFHQILQWHHFFDWSTSTFGIVSDGLLHAGELIALVGGVFLLVDLSRQQKLAITFAWSGFFLGMGGFQLFDGLVNHKLLRLHQIRYNVDLLVYDLTWNLSALVLLAIGFWLYRQANKKRPGNRSRH